METGEGLNRASVPEGHREAAKQGRPKQVMKANLCNSPASPDVPLCLKSPIFRALGKWLLKGAGGEPFRNVGRAVPPTPALGPWA